MRCPPTNLLTTTQTAASRLLPSDVESHNGTAQCEHDGFGRSFGKRYKPGLCWMNNLSTLFIHKHTHVGPGLLLCAMHVVRTSQSQHCTRCCVPGEGLRYYENLAANDRGDSPTLMLRVPHFSSLDLPPGDHDRRCIHVLFCACLCPCTVCLNA